MPETDQERKDYIDSLLGKRAKQATSKVVGDFQKLPFRALFPFGAWFGDQPWNLVWVRWFAIYALLPLAFSLYLIQSQGSQDQLAWMFTLYFASVWLGFLTYCMKPEPCGLTVAKVVGLTLLIGTPIALWLDSFGMISAIHAGTKSQDDVTRWLSYLLTTGPVEEVSKMVAVFVFAYMMEPQLRPKTFAYLGAAAGLAFGVAEAVAYSQKYANDLLTGQSNLPSYLLNELVRLLSLPLLHALFSGIAGYFLGLAARYKKAPYALIVLGIAVAAICHGTYDAFADSWLGLAAAAGTMLIFISYVRSGEEIAKAVEG